tara:strand:- start:469 stop:1734 length:1266 start_codon:yes stop_codon:yes gene_type:complete
MLTKTEIGLLKYFDNTTYYKRYDKELIVDALKSMGVFNSNLEIYQFYRLWSENGRKGLDYTKDELSKPGNTLFQVISNIIEMSQYDRDVFDDSENIKDVWGSDYDIFNFEFDGEGLNITTDQENWLEYFSGMSEGDPNSYVFYQMAQSHEGSRSEEFEQEFDYVNTNGDTISLLEKIANLLGIPPPSPDDYNEEGKIRLFLSSFLPSENLETIMWDYLWDYEREVGRARDEAIMGEYNEEIKYDFEVEHSYSYNNSASEYKIHIPYEDLLEFIEENELLSLSELKDIEINGDIDLESSYNDTYLDDEGYDSVVNTFNSSLEKLIEEIEDESILYDKIEEKVGGVKMLQKIIKDLNLIKTTQYGDVVYHKKSKEFIRFKLDDVDYPNYQLKIFYKNKPIWVNFDDLSNWVLGSVLDFYEDDQ